MSDDFPEGELTSKIIGAFYATYNALGFGFLESVYARALDLELRRRGLRVEREVTFKVFYEDECVGVYRVDFLVEGKIVLELKSTENLRPHFRRQLLNGITAAGLPVGLLLHYGPEPHVYRVVRGSI